MNPLLDHRYLTLFANYGTGADEILLKIKSQIAEALERAPGLRPDAAYFLLLNFDHMIRIPCSGYVPQKDDLVGRPMPAPIELQQIEEKIRYILTEILEDLARNEEPPFSSHAVIRSVDRNWREMARVLLW